MIRILTNTVFKRIMVVLLIIVLAFCIFPMKAKAFSFLYYIGGTILDMATKFLVFLGDCIMNILQKNFISTQDVVIRAESKTFSSLGSAGSWLTFIIGVLVVVTAVIVAVTSFGTLSWASFGGVMAGIKMVGGVFLGVAGGSYLAVKGGKSIYDDWIGEYDLPMIRYTPYEIFSNQIPVFDINFINPMASIEERIPDEDNSAKFELIGCDANLDALISEAVGVLISDCSDTQIKPETLNKINEIAESLNNQYEQYKKISAYTIYVIDTIEGKEVKAYITWKETEQIRATCEVDGRFVYSHDSEEQGGDRTVLGNITSIKESLKGAFSSRTSYEADNIRATFKSVGETMYTTDGGTEQPIGDSNKVEKEFNYTHTCNGKTVHLKLVYDHTKTDERWTCYKISGEKPEFDDNSNILCFFSKYDGKETVITRYDYTTGKDIDTGEILNDTSLNDKIMQDVTKKSLGENATSVNLEEIYAVKDQVIEELEAIAKEGNGENEGGTEQLPYVFFCNTGIEI